MIFQNNFIFTGKYNKMARAMTSVGTGKDNPNGINIFANGYHCLLYAAAVGIRNNELSPKLEPKKEKEQEKEDTQTLKVFYSQLSNPEVEETLKFLFETAMLQYKGENGELSEQERIKRAFKPVTDYAKTEEDRELTRECEDVFRRYVYGGLGLIYDFFEDEIKAKEKNSLNFDQERLEMKQFKFLKKNISLSGDDLEKLGNNFG